LIGLALPSTRLEDERMGEASDGLVEKAKETGQEALDHGKQVAGEVAQQVTETATETAQQSGKEHAEELKESAGVSSRGESGPEGTTASSGATSESGGRKAAGGGYQA
jgi:hypothetical protein